MLVPSVLQWAVPGLCPVLCNYNVYIHQIDNSSISLAAHTANEIEISAQILVSKSGLRVK